jgi:hypothetical protein
VKEHRTGSWYIFTLLIRILGDLKARRVWGAFAECNFWIKNLNKTPLNFLKPSSQVNNFTVFFNFSLECEKVFFQSAWVTSQFPVQTNLVWKTREN